jgi:hypothetical protein
MADKTDAALLIQLAQWGTTMGIEESQQTIWADDFDPEAADPRDVHVARVLNWGESIGTLTKNGLLDQDLVLDWLWVSGMWAKVGPAAMKLRATMGEDSLYENFEALAAQQAG